MNLVIVESPTKAKTISRFLSGDFVIKSSYGHVRDLPKSKIGVDVANGFEPTYVIPPKAKKAVTELKRSLSQAHRIILATDEDREGEAIAWHLIEALGLNSKSQMANRKSSSNKSLAISHKPAIERIVFHEITKPAIEAALKNPRQIDLRLVNAQQARRILDRLVGYELSPFLWKKIKYGLSAGRVQSVALRLIAEREREIQAFTPQEYWEIIVKLAPEKSKEKDSAFEAKLAAIDGKPVGKLDIQTKEEAEAIAKNLKQASYQVAKVEKKESRRNPLPPFTTSTLQQAAWQRLRLSAKQTMMFAQQLYESGFITYMRTDSVNLSRESLAAAREFLTKKLSASYALQSPRYFRGKTKLAQEAHEAIRPTDPFNTPDSLKKEFQPRAAKLYELIWQRFLASQMPPAIIQATLVAIAASGQGRYGFRTSGQTILFDGFLKIWPSKVEEVKLPALEKDDALTLLEILPSQHFTEPRPRFNDASLVKSLEEYGIGRPSTYAPTISTIQERGYVERDERRYFQPTSIGFLVNDILVKHFQDIVSFDFTARMEEELDEIAEGKRDWVPVIKEFYGPFQKNLKLKYEEVSRREATERPSEEICDKCGRPMVIKHGRYGDFLACSGYPECSNIKKIPKPTLGIKCPKCKEGDVVMRRTKARKRIFYGCSRWPACDFASWKKPSNEDEENGEVAGEARLGEEN